VAVYEYAGTVDTAGVDQGTNYKLSPAIGSRLANTPPVVTITAPANNSTYAKNAPITFTGTSIDNPDGNISSGLVWYSNLTGPIGTGANATTSSLLPGTHIITAKSTDSNGESSTATISVSVTPLKGPHGGFNGSTDQCAACHRAHSAQGSDYLTTDPNSVLTSDTFCLNCHPGVSTHSNTDWGAAVEPHFEVRCVQCHDPHGNSNLFNVKTQIETSLSPVATVGPVTFTAMTGANSFDDGTSTNRLCVVCHTSTTHHPGGANHQDPTVTTSYTLDHTGQSCVACHPHNADGNALTLDGFMPVRNTNP
jgi:predicted CXXCH cytochrome family protein